MSPGIFLSVIIPAYNEEKSIGQTLDEIAGYLAKKQVAYEIIVVDDGSVDNTIKYAESRAVLFNNFTVLKNTDNKGKGYSVKRGVLSAHGEYILFMDADNSTSIYEFDKFLPFLENGYDAVIASRRLKGSNVEEPQPFLRAKMGQFYITLSRIILDMNVSDFNCGFKVYNGTAARRIFPLQSMNDWSFDVELLFLANKYNLKVREVPVRWVHKSGSKVKPFKDAVKSFLSLIKIKFNDIRHIYT